MRAPFEGFDLQGFWEATSGPFGHGAAFWRREWGYPDFGICIADTPSGGHEMIMLDYSGCGPRGEPRVVYVDQESDYEVTFLAANFEGFIRGLVNQSVYDDSVERLAFALQCVEHGSFTPLLAEVVADDPAIGLALRRICLELTRAKGHFSLHADELSRLVYDVLFYAYAKRHPVPDAEAYLAAYPAMLVLGDGGFTTGGYAPAFVEDWLGDARASASIVARPDGGLSLSTEARTRVASAIEEWGG